MSFALDERLQRDTLLVGDMPLCRVLMMNDARFPWAILVPRRDGAAELTDLDAADRAVLVEETAAVANWLRRETAADKINVGALGNIVRQLHVHVIARFAGDAAWPGPVWGQGTPQPYDAREAALFVAEARSGLGLVGDAAG